MSGRSIFYTAFAAGALLRRMLAYASVVYGFDVLQSATWSGLFYLALLLPYLLWSLPAGLLVDTHGARRVLRGATLAATGALGALTCTVWRGGLSGSAATAWLLAALLFLYGTTYAASYTAFIAAIPAIVEPPAVARTTIGANVLALVTLAYAPLAVGGLRAAMDWPAVFAVLTGAAMLSALGASTVPLRGRAAIPPGGPKADLRGLAAYCRTHPRLAGLLAVAVAFSALAVGPLEVLLPQFAEGPMALGPLSAGAFIAVGGTGLVLGALLALRLGLGPHTHAWLCGSATLSAVLIVALTLTPRAAMLPLLFASGIMGGLFSSLNIAATQACAEDAIRGRIMGLFSLIVGGMPGLGGIAAGLLSAGLGSVAAMRLGYAGAAGAFVVLYFWLRPARTVDAARPG